MKSDIGIRMESRAAFYPKVGGHRERGHRQRNDDCFKIINCTAAVSDGVGGAAFGDIMSRIGVSVVVEEVAGLPYSGEDEQEILENAFNKADEAARQTLDWLGASDCGSGATLIVARWSPLGEMSLAWAGDSRAFVFTQDGDVESLSKQLDRDAATNVLLNGIGLGKKVETHFTRKTVEAGSTVLLCTDGVWGVYLDGDGGEAELKKLLFESDMTAPLLARKVAMSAAGKGSDNATAIIISF